MANSTPVAGQWVWVPDPADPTTGQWHWFVPGAPQGRGFDVGRLGMFVGGYFCLGIVFAAYAVILRGLGANSESAPAPVVEAPLSIAFAIGLFALARRTWSHTLEPVGIMGALASNVFVARGVWMSCEVLGVDDGTSFYVTAFVITPLLVATLVRLPHPILGLSVAIGVLVSVVSAPLPGGGSTVGARALICGLLLAVLACTVEARTRSRAGSLLHYGAVIAMLVAKVSIVDLVADGRTDSLGTAALLPLAMFELSLALVTQRRSWTFSGWLTLAVAIGGVISSVLEPLGIEDGTGHLVGPVIVAVSYLVQRRRGAATERLLAALPPSVRPKVLWFAPVAPPAAPVLPTGHLENHWEKRSVSDANSQ